jgi:hypothetical protein
MCNLRAHGSELGLQAGPLLLVAQLLISRHHERD